jgi:DNA-binding NarL/FixJ family response regulator
VTTRVLLADDDALLRAGVATVLETAAGIELVGEAASGREAVAACRELGPDVVLMDVRMPGMDGIEATRRIVASGADARVLILTTFELDEYVFASLRAGASGFLLKRTSPERLIEAIETVAEGDGLLDPAVTRRLIAAFAAQPSPSRGVTLPDDLTERERDVLRLIAAGRSNRELAAELFIAESTAKTHVKRVLAKLGARDRAQAVVAAYESGLVAPGRPRR